MVARLKKNSSRTPFLPDGVAEDLKKRGFEILGFLLVLFALIILAALLSYNASDPSLNTASDKVVSNMVGPLGAYFADVSFQTMGLGGYALIPIFFAWGWRLVLHGTVTLAWLRVSLLPMWPSSEEPEGPTSSAR